VQDHLGNPTDDPGVLSEEPKGTLLPTGGLDAGHKGYSLALLIEALTAGLSGHGRVDPSDGWEQPCCKSSTWKPSADSNNLHARWIG
jgi:LDH2 family malate/lactate/ureidoglycolate dehydrogenase